MERSWRPSRLLRVSCDRVGTGSCPPACQKSLGSLKDWPATTFAQPWLCRKREEIIFFTLLSCLKRLRLGNWVGCLAIDLEIKLFFVHLWCLWLCAASAPCLGQHRGCARAVEPDVLTACVASGCHAQSWAVV